MGTIRHALDYALVSVPPGLNHWGSALFDSYRGLKHKNNLYLHIRRRLSRISGGVLFFEATIRVADEHRVWAASTAQRDTVLLRVPAYVDQGRLVTWVAEQRPLGVVREK